MALINAANDSDAKVRASVASSLHDIGYRQTPMVVSSCVDWLLKNAAKAAKEHKVAILNVTNRLVEEKRDLVSLLLPTPVFCVFFPPKKREKKNPVLTETVDGGTHAQLPLHPHLTLMIDHTRVGNKRGNNGDGRACDGQRGRA